MKIALVSPYDFAFPGGVVNHISALKRYFIRMGHEVRIIAPASKAVTDHADHFIQMGSPRPVPASGSIARITLSLRLSSKIKDVLREEKFDIIHLHEPFVPMLCTAVLRFADTACVGTFHACRGLPSYYFGWPFTPLLLKRRDRKICGKIAVSAPALEFAQEHVPGDYSIIPNGIDLGHFNPDVTSLEEFDDGKLNILFVGRLERRKGLHYLLRAYARLKPEMPASRLIVVGPGSRLRRKYQGQVLHTGLEDVHFIGYASYRDLPRFYKTAHIYCSPAVGSESFGIVLLEAMAMGKAVVASNIAGYASVVTDGSDGILVPPRDDKALAQSLLSLLTDESLRRRLGEKGRETAIDYSWDSIGQRVLDYYDKVLSESPWRERYRQTEALPPGYSIKGMRV